ncbi:MFS transporter [soil metagenome]
MVGTLFVINGVLVGTWVSRIPALKAQFVLTDAALGVALLFVASGSLVAFPFAGRVVTRSGGAWLAVAGALLMCVALPAAAFAPSAVLLWAALFAFGAGNGANDVAMNAQAVEVERARGRPLLSSFHAMWSSGALLGAGIGAALIVAGRTPAEHFVLVVGVAAAVLILGVAVPMRSLPVAPARGRSTVPAPAFSLPPRALAGVGVVVFAAALAEGAVGDWSAVYLLEGVGTTEASATAGYAAFAVAMLVARALGDALTARWGPVRVVALGGMIATLGLAVALLVALPWLSVLGFACVGWGVASAFPLAFSAAGNMPRVDPGTGVAAVATMGYAGFLVGPLAIGVLAEGASLRLALVVVVLCAALMGALAVSLRPATPPTVRDPGVRSGSRR